MTCSDASLFDDVLAPAIPDARKLVAEFDHARSLSRSLPGAIEHETRWEMFALSAVNDCLIAPMAVTTAQYRTFFEEIGFEPFDATTTAFEPALCEIVSVVNDTYENRDVRAHGPTWPGLRFGELIFSRCGVGITGDKSHGIVKGIADRSCLYFTSYRQGRDTNHTWDGWGSNSRWRSSFDRDYIVGDQVFLNVDGEHDLALATPDHEDLDGLSIEAMQDILIHRCAVRFPDNADVFPYFWRLRYRRSEAWRRDKIEFLPWDRNDPLPDT